MLALLCGAGSTGQASGQPGGQPTTYTFAEVSGVPLELDFYPAFSGDVPSPLIVWIHGGGWQTGSNDSTGPSLTFRSAGYAVASLSYRLVTQGGIYGDAAVVWPAQAHDVKAAVRWLRANADQLGIDPCRFIAWGPSAGAHLAAVLGTTNGDPFLEGTLGDHTGVSSDVQLAVSFFGPTELLFLAPDVTDPPGTSVAHDEADSGPSLLLGSALHGHSVGEIRENATNPSEPWPTLNSLAASASPAVAATDAAGNVPFFIAHGDQDDVVPIAQSVRLVAALTAAGTPVEYLPIAGGGHGLLVGSLAPLADWLNTRVPLLGSCECIADLALPAGVLDLADVAAFITAFTAQDTPADLDGDGVFDLADLAAFVTAFTAGCP